MQRLCAASLRRAPHIGVAHGFFPQRSCLCLSRRRCATSGPFGGPAGAAENAGDTTSANCINTDADNLADVLLDDTPFDFDSARSNDDGTLANSGSSGVYADSPAQQPGEASSQPRPRPPPPTETLSLADRPPDVSEEEWAEFVRYVQAVEESDLGDFGLDIDAAHAAGGRRDAAEGSSGESGHSDTEGDIIAALRRESERAYFHQRDTRRAGAGVGRSILAPTAAEMEAAAMARLGLAGYGERSAAELLEGEGTVAAGEELEEAAAAEEEAEDGEGGPPGDGEPTPVPSLNDMRAIADDPRQWPLRVPDRNGVVPPLPGEKPTGEGRGMDGAEETPRAAMADGNSYLAVQDRLYLSFPPRPETIADPPAAVPAAAAAAAAGGHRCVMAVFAHNDLRTHDNYVLALAAAAAEARGLPLVAVCVLDFRTFAQPSAVGGFYRQSPQRARWLLDNVAALRERLEGDEFGVPLLVRCGRPEEHVPRLAADLGAAEVFLTTQYSPHEGAVHDAIVAAVRAGVFVSREPLLPALLEGEAEPLQEGEEAGTAEVFARVVEHAREGAECRVHSVWQTTLVHLDDLPTPVAAMREGERWYHDDVTIAAIRPTAPYDALAARAALLPRWEALLPGPQERAGLAPPPVVRGALPTLLELGYGDVERHFAFEEIVGTDYSHPAPGEAAAQAHVAEWLAQGGLTSMLRVGREKRTNTKLYSHLLARVSPYVSLGVLSVRRLYEMIRAHTHAHLDDGSAHMQYREALLRLSRRDYWHWVGLRYGARLFYSYGPRPSLTGDLPDWRPQLPKVVQRWCMGLTGIPFADAALRELRGTGWVANEGRQAAVWLLARGYGQDWRLAAEWLERCSLDYDPFVCYGNCAYVCELLRDDYGERVRNTLYLAHHHDQTGIYIKKWIPALARVPPVYIHRPHVMTARMQAIHHVQLGRNYPYPIKLWDGAQHTLGARELTAYYAGGLRSGPGYGEAARHGRAVLPPEEWRLTRPSASSAEAGPGRRQQQQHLRALSAVGRREWAAQFLPASAFEGLEEDALETVTVKVRTATATTDRRAQHDTTA